MEIELPERTSVSGREAVVVPVQSVIDISGLIPPTLDSNGQIAIDKRTGQTLVGNLDKKLPEIEEVVKKSHSWLYRLAGEVRDHKKSAIVFAVTGGIMVLSAIGARYEFGVRHGEDLKTFIDRFSK